MTIRNLILGSFVLVSAALAQAPPTYTISTVAGTNPSGDNGPARSARLNRPADLVIDPQGIIYFCDRKNYRIRRIGRDQTITTIAGGGEIGAIVDGQPATSALLFDPIGIALDATRNILYFSDSVAHNVYSVNLANGTISIVAGTGESGFAGDGGSAKRARLNGPRGIAFEPTVGLLITDTNNHRIRRVDLTTGAISTIVGSGVAGFSGDGATAITGQLAFPYSVAIGPDRSIYIADWGNSRIRRVKPDNTLETVAGNGSIRFSGDNGPALNSSVDGYHVTVAADGTLYLADQLFHRVRRVTPAGIISTVVGTGSTNNRGTGAFSGDGGLATIAQLDGPTATALDANGTSLLVADGSNHRLRRFVISAGSLDTVAGRNRFGGEAVQATAALFTSPENVAYDAAGNLYVADTGNHCVRRIGRDGVVTTVAGVGGEAGLGAENILAINSRLNNPSAIAIDTDGTLYIADRGNFRVRRIDPAGFVRTISGNDPFLVQDLVLQANQRRLYFTDSFYHQILRIDLANPNAPPVPIAGSPNFRAGFSGDGGPAINAFVRSPRGIALAPNGDLYFVDSGNLRLRRIDTAGNISTVAGNGEAELNATDGPATNSTLSFPSRIAIDAQGNIFLSEELNRIRRISISGNRIDTVAGQRLYGYSGDGGPALQARLDTPAGIALASDGTLVIADALNHRLRRLTAATAPPPNVVTKLEIRSGNNQTANTGQLLPQALTVTALSGTNQPIAGVPIGFAVTTGAATLSAASVTTGSDGVASITVTLGATAGPVQITASSGSLAPVVFSLTATTATQPPPNPLRPLISRGGIIGVGASVPAVTTVTARGIVSIFGQNFLEAGVAGRRVNFETESSGGVLPTRHLGLCVEIGGVRAGMLDAFGTQLNVVVPSVSGATAAVRVIRRCDQPDAVTSEPETVAVANAAPEFLYSQLNLDGRNPVAAVNAVSGALIGPATLPGFVPAQSGDILTIYANGFGTTDPPIKPGGTSTGIANVTSSVRVRIGTVDLAPADILYVGASPSLLIYQVNLRVPAGLPAGNLPIQIFLNGVASPPNAYLAITGNANLEKSLLERARSSAEPTKLIQ